MYSTVTFEGNLAADVEVKENKTGGVYVDAVVLVNQGKDTDGTDRTPTRWQARITGRTGENAANLRKGTRLLVTGSVVTDSWTDKLDRLIGPLPECLAVYESRSPSNLVDQIDRPVLFAHGLDDSVVPAAAVESLVQELRSRGTPHVARLFEHEGHPPSRPENRAALLQAEFDFYQAVFAGEPELAARRSA